MRILLVDAFASANKDISHGDRYERVRQHVVAVIKELEKTEVTNINLVVRVSVCCSPPCSLVKLNALCVLAGENASGAGRLRV